MKNASQRMERERDKHTMDNAGSPRLLVSWEPNMVQGERVDGFPLLDLNLNMVN